MVQVSNTMLLNATHIHRDVTRRDGDMLVTLDFEARFLRFRLMRATRLYWMMDARL